MASFDKVIAPGQEGKITLSVKTNYFRGGKFAKSATISSNDPKQPSLSIRLKGEVKEYISVKPSSRVYLTGFDGDILSKRLKIINHQDSPLNITHIESDIDDKINYELKPIVEGKEYQLIVKTRAELKGKNGGKITLTTNSEKKPKIEIRVSINLRDELIISPSTLHFGNIPIATKPDKLPTKLRLTKHIMVSKERGDPVKIEKLKSSSDIIHTKIETKEEGKKYFIIVTLDEDKLKKGLIKETLEIHTNYKKRPVFKINVNGKVI